MNFSIKKGFTQTKIFSITGNISFTGYSISLVVVRGRSLIKSYASNELVLDNAQKTIQVTFTPEVTSVSGQLKAYFIFSDGEDKKISLPNNFFTIDIIDDLIS